MDTGKGRFSLFSFLSDVSSERHYNKMLSLSVISKSAFMSVFYFHQFVGGNHRKGWYGVLEGKKRPQEREAAVLAVCGSAPVSPSGQTGCLESRVRQ